MQVCQVQEAAEGVSNQPEFRPSLTAKQLEVRDFEQLRWKLEKPHLLLLFPLFPSSESNLEGVKNQDWQDKAGVEKPNQKKNFLDAALAIGRTRE